MFLKKQINSTKCIAISETVQKNRNENGYAIVLWDVNA